MSSTRQKVLIISYRFPPSPSVGGLRIQGLAKYLSEFDWESIILTTKLPDTPNTQFRVIQTQSNDAILSSWKKRLGFKPEEGVKKKLGIPTHKNKKTFIDHGLTFLNEIIAYPDVEKGWYNYAVKAGSKILKNENIDAIISSSSPVTCHLIAKELKMKYTIPWIADLRDLWTQNHYYQYSIIRKMIERRLEKKTLSKADALVTVSLPLAEKLKRLHQDRSVYVITNGFDLEEGNIMPKNLAPKFTITYTGSIYYGKQSPLKLLQATRGLISEGVIDPNDLEIRFYGRVTKLRDWWLEEKIKQLELQNEAKFYGEIPREKAIEKQRTSQILLFLGWEDPKERGVYTAKIFEYLAAQRPILATGGPKGVVKELLADTNAGIYATTVEDVKKALEEYYNEYKLKDNVSYKGERAKIDKYSQREMARKFAEVLGTLTRK